MLLDKSQHCFKSQEQRTIFTAATHPLNLTKRACSITFTTITSVASLVPPTQSNDMLQLTLHISYDRSMVRPAQTRLIFQKIESEHSQFLSTRISALIELNFQI